MQRHRPLADRVPGSATRDSTTNNHEDRHRKDQDAEDPTAGYRHNPDRCRTCDPDRLVYLTIADEWRAWALDFGHTIGTKAVA